MPDLDRAEARRHVLSDREGAVRERGAPGAAAEDAGGEHGSGERERRDQRKQDEERPLRARRRGGRGDRERGAVHATILVRAMDASEGGPTLITVRDRATERPSQGPVLYVLKRFPRLSE